MLVFFWPIVYRLSRRIVSVCDSSFEMVCLFALLGLVFTALLLNLDGRLMPALPRSL